MIPILDWKEFSNHPGVFAQKLGKVCREHGFFLLKNHDVSPKLIDDVFKQSDAFFALPTAEKKNLSIELNDHNRGWVEIGAESLAENSGQVDQKQAFNIGLEIEADDPAVLRGDAFRGANKWPEIDGFRNTLLNYFSATLKQGVALHEAFARDLGLQNNFFKKHFTAPMATLRLLSYPSASGERDEIGAGEHTDYGSVTLLVTDGVGGLQVKAGGAKWLDVPHEPNTFVINIGDCLMRWTNGIYSSTPHRVVSPSQPRRSIAFFLDPNPDSLISSLPGTGTSKFPPILAADYLRSRLNATYKEDSYEETP